MSTSPARGVSPHFFRPATWNVASPRGERGKPPSKKGPSRTRRSTDPPVPPKPVASGAPPPVATTPPISPPPIPPIITPAPAFTQNVAQSAAPPLESLSHSAIPKAAATAGLPPISAALRPLDSAAHASRERSFEMRLGTHWVPRIGIVMVLTGLVFFGNYAHQHFIVRLGPAGKVLLLYLASGSLLVAGAWWQRKAAKESLRNYAQVLFAGGLAAVYFTTYAAYHIETLRVIQSPLLDGALLLVCAATMAWTADRKKSEV